MCTDLFWGAGFKNLKEPRFGARSVLRHSGEAWQRFLGAMKDREADEKLFKDQASQATGGFYPLTGVDLCKGLRGPYTCLLGVRYVKVEKKVG